MPPPCSDQHFTAILDENAARPEPDRREAADRPAESGEPCPAAREGEQTHICDHLCQSVANPNHRLNRLRQSGARHDRTR